MPGLPHLPPPPPPPSSFTLIGALGQMGKTFHSGFRYQVLQKTVPPYYVVTESLLTNQACYSDDTKESCTRFKCWM